MDESSLESPYTQIYTNSGERQLFYRSLMNSTFLAPVIDLWMNEFISSLINEAHYCKRK